MTTDHELHDLLSADADGPIISPAGWDDVVQRGTRRRRATRIRNGLAAGGLAALAVVAAVTVADPGDRDQTGVVANDPDGTTVPTTGPVTTTSVVDPGLLGPGITQARTQGVFVTVLMAPSTPAVGFDPCTDLHPRVTETATEVRVELVDASFSSGSPWAACQASAFSGHGTIELLEPVGDRRVIDESSGAVVPVSDSAGLLFPSSVPAPFVLERWDEFAGVPGEGQMWTFSFPAGALVLNITSDYVDLGECDGLPVTVRNQPGTLCDGILTWTEDGSVRAIEVADVNGQPVPADLDLVAIAQGLEPLGGGG